ncbi:MAG: lysine--tRNA ligase [Patescibacteria group bacterium]
MYWADKIAESIVSSKKFKPYWVDDMKTLSGFAHIGSIRGPIIHDLIYKSLKANGQKVKYTFVFNDFDPIDSLSSDLKEKFSNYMGVPLRAAPSPQPGYKSFADYFCSNFREVFKTLGIEAEFLSSWDMYHEGKFDEVIRVALDNTEKIQDIYKRISGSQKKEQGWLPFQVVCENCGKLGTTKVYAWDGKEVSYRCEPNLVTWAQGCGHEGKISPFGGTGKLPWKVDWPAHWRVIGVTIEGAGKDLASKGGAYDIAMEISEEVFGYSRPYKLPYEHFLIGGRKMSTSKGLGLRARDWIKMVPPEIGRFLFVKSNYREALEFNPFGTMAIPDLFDEYDRCWKAFVEGSDETLARTFELAQIKRTPPKKDLFLPRFKDVANYLQFPDVVLAKKFAEIKGAELTKEELGILAEREKYAKVWVEEYAPAEYRVGMSEELPKEASKLDREQKEFLSRVANLLEKMKDPGSLQQELYKVAKKGGEVKKAFAGIYLAMIGQDHGPKAAWFLLSYPKEKVIKRLKEASK